jgi:hypothetical protein
MLIDAVLAAADLKLSGAFDIGGSALIGRDAAGPGATPSGITIVDSIERGIDGADCVIDFTRPAGTLAHLNAARSRKVNFVIGTTGFDDKGLQQIRHAAQSRGIVFAPNMSVGVNVTLKHWPPTTTSKSTKRITATKSMRRLARHSEWAKLSPERPGDCCATASCRRATATPASGLQGRLDSPSAAAVILSAITQ